MIRKSYFDTCVTQFSTRNEEALRKKNGRCHKRSNFRDLWLRVFLSGICLYGALVAIQCKHTAETTKDIPVYKAFLDRIISAEDINADLRLLTAEPHMASSPRNEKLAEFIYNEWRALGLDEVRLAQYDVLLSFPEEISVELISPRRISLKLKEIGYEEDPDTQREDIGVPYNAYSLSGDITAPLVYANSGNPQDYDFCERKGIDLKGKVALVRYSAPYSYRGFKALTAEKRGLVGLLIYSDPMEDGTAKGPVFPDGPWGPMSHIQRGGIPYDFIYPGDPLTPGWASKPGCERIPEEKAASLPQIISVPLSAEDALPLLENMGGVEAPEEWRGALPVPYRLGGSQAVIRMKVRMASPIKRITNVIGCLKGSAPSEGIIIAGNHRDAWIFGGHDPSSGTACMMELVRAFAEAKKAGFRPRRTVYFASWDAEEFTLTGSTEWGEENREMLQRDLVAYLNVDSAAAGRDFSVQAVPCLNHVVEQALKEVLDPATQKPVYESLVGQDKSQQGIDKPPESEWIEPIGSGSDHTVFLNHIGAPALDMTFSGDYGVYHSVYDNYYWMTRFGDPGMRYTATLAKIWGHIIVELGSRPFLPLDYETYAGELKTYLGDWAEKHDPERKQGHKLFSLLDDLEEKALMLNSFISSSSQEEEVHDPQKTRRVNRLLMQLERNFTVPQGIPDRPWFKHLVFGTRYTYAVLLLPELTEASEAGDEQGIARALRNLERSTEKSIADLKEGIDILKTISE